MEGLKRSIQKQIDDDGTMPGLEAQVVDGQIRLNYEPAVPTDLSLFDIVGTNDINNAIGILDKSGNPGFFTAEKDVNSQVEGFTNYDAAGGGAITVDVDDGGGGATPVTLYTEQNVKTASDMVTADYFVQTVNETLDGNEDIRVDIVDNAIAFTSTRVGRKNNDGAPADESLVVLSGLGAEAGTLFGIDAGTAKGSGDKNFRLHVVTNNPQFQIGAERGQTMTVSMGNMSAEALGVNNLDLTSIEGANSALGKINQAIDKVSAERSKLGAFQNGLEYAINNLRNTHGNLTSAESRIRDADIAMEMIEFTRNQIVAQTGTAMLAQANLLPQGVLELLRECNSNSPLC